MKNMKKGVKGLLALVMAIAVVVGFTLYSGDRRLKASEDDGNTSASEQQEEVKQEEKPVVVEVPKQEEPKEEPKAEEAKEEPAEEESAAEEEQEEPAAEPETAEEAPAAEETAEETAAEENGEQEELSEETAEETAEEAVEETVEENGSAVRADIKMENSGDIHYGDTITLDADVSGAEGEYKVYWQYNDGTGWKDLGASGTQYNFVLDENNAHFDYRVVVEC